MTSISLSTNETDLENVISRHSVHRHRALAIERDKLVQDIRGLPSFKRFLLQKESRASACCGPVAILNAAESRCDALIVLHGQEDVVHVPLPGVTVEQLRGFHNDLEILLGPARVVPSGDRAAKMSSRPDSSWEFVLSALWTGVIKPVLDALGLLTPGDLSRIFWCPTGAFMSLPLHAAGLYGPLYSEPGHKVFDFVISSYVPSLSVLTPTTRDVNPSSDLRILVVPQSPSDGQVPLPGVHTELDHIRTVVDNSASPAVLLEPSSGTVEEVLGLMINADWVHFACPVVQDAENPSKSGICLADNRRLTLSDMISLSRPRGGLAFLSACQAAMGDRASSNEAVHITAGMLFAGYGGVIGTMWSTGDGVAPRVARDVYEQLFRRGTTPDHREAVRALHNAVDHVRGDGTSFVEWVPFIHVGL